MSRSILVRRIASAAIAALLAFALGAAPLSAQPGDECVTAFFATDGLNPFDTAPMTGSPDPFSTAQCPGTGFGVMNRDLWFAYIAVASGPLVVSTCGLASFDTDLVVYTGSCGALAQVACNGDGPSATCPGFSSTVTVAAIAGVQYWIRIGGYDPLEFGTGQLSIQSFPALPGDECSFPLFAFEGINSFDTTGYSNSADSYDDLQCATTDLGSMARDGWWQYTPFSDGDLTVSLCGLSLLDSDLVIYEGTCGSLTQIACDGDSGCGFPSEVTVPVSGSVTYTIRMGSWSPTSPGDVGSFSVSLVPAALTPFKRGDADGDGCVDPVLDALYISAYIFPPPGGPPVSIGCLEAADVNGDVGINIADIVFLLGWGFPSGGIPNPIPAPGPDVCGPGTGTPGCASYACVPCVPPPVDPDIVLRLVPTGPPGPSIPVEVRLDSDVSTVAYSFGVCHTAGVDAATISQGSALLSLPFPASVLFVTEIIPGAGWTAGIVTSVAGAQSLPATADAPLAVATYSCAGGTTASLTFCDTLGANPVPISAAVFGGTGATPTTVGTSIGCGAPPPGSFIRGDISGDGVRDMTDAILLEQFLYPGVLPFGPPPEPLGCDLVPNQSGDLNDNEVETIADLLMFLGYLNCGAITIPEPSSLCGDDVDDDTVGFDTIDTDYLLSAFTISVTGAVDEVRSVDVLLQVKSPTPVKALSLSLEIGAGLSLAPVPLTLAGGVSADFFGTLIDGNLVSVAAGSTTCGTPMMPSTGLAFAQIATLHLQLAPFATFPPCQLIQEADVLGHVRRTTIVDPFFQDHQPLFLSGSGTIFARGNANNLDFDVNIADAIWILSHLFPGGPPVPLECIDAADANNSGAIDIADPIYLLGFLFSGGPIIPYPYPECGYDIDIDGIDINNPGMTCDTPICP